MGCCPSSLYFKVECIHNCTIEDAFNLSANPEQMSKVLKELKQGKLDHVELIENSTGDHTGGLKSKYRWVNKNGSIHQEAIVTSITKSDKEIIAEMEVVKGGQGQVFVINDIIPHPTFKNTFTYTNDKKVLWVGECSGHVGCCIKCIMKLMMRKIMNKGHTINEKLLNSDVDARSSNKPKFLIR